MALKRTYEVLMERMKESIALIRNALNRVRVSGREDCYAIVAINNELDRMEKAVEKAAEGENG